MKFDTQKFSTMMSELGMAYRKEYTKEQVGLWLRIFEKRRDSLESVIAAIQAHMEDQAEGKFAPMPAHIIGQLEKDSPGDGRIDADEAWAICRKSFDEDDTVCVNDEIMQARAVAELVFQSGDEVGARMAFRSAYNRIVGEARCAARPMKWFLSLGQDKERRETAIRAAVAAHRLTADETRHLLPPPPAEGVAAEIAGLIAGKVVKHPSADDAVSRQRIAELRAALGMGDRRAKAAKSQEELDQWRAEADAFLESRGVA